jgi:hypothetical protein
MSKISRRLNEKSKRMAKRYFDKVFPELVVKTNRRERRLCLTLPEFALAIAEAIARGELSALTHVCKEFERKSGVKLTVVKAPGAPLPAPKPKKKRVIQPDRTWGKTLSNAELNSGWKQGYANTSNWP